MHAGAWNIFVWLRIWFNEGLLCMQAVLSRFCCVGRKTLKEAKIPRVSKIALAFSLRSQTLHVAHRVLRIVSCCCLTLHVVSVVLASALFPYWPQPSQSDVARCTLTLLVYSLHVDVSYWPQPFSLLSPHTLFTGFCRADYPQESCLFQRS